MRTQCWWTQRSLADLIDGSLPPRRRPAIEAHIAACDGCRRELDDQRSTVRLLARAGACGAVLAAAPPGFEERVLRSARERQAASVRPALIPRPVALALGPFSLGAALALLVVAVLLSLSLGRPADSTSRLEPVRADAGADREIPFTLREDLLGSRRGRIPETTYVLEPAPERGDVVRASF